MPLSPEEVPDARAELTRIERTLDRLDADRDGEAFMLELVLRALKLRRLLDGERGLGPIREDGFYGSGL